MDNIEIRHRLCAADGYVNRIAFARNHKYLATVSGNNGLLYISNPRDLDGLADARAFRVGAIGFRTSLLDAESGRTGTEVLYTTRDPAVINAIDLDSSKFTYRQMFTECEYPVACIQESGDGRYLAIGDISGHVTVWNFDLFDLRPHQSPGVVFSKEVGQGQIIELAFDRHNKRLFISDQKGQLFAADLYDKTVMKINNDHNWVCLSIDCHKKDSGIAFAGVGNRVWLAESTSGVDQEIKIEEIPFQFLSWVDTQGQAHVIMPAFKPKTRVSYIDTGVGDFISKVNFWKDRILVVVGQLGIEMWDLLNRSCFFRIPNHAAMTEHNIPLHIISASQCQDEMFIAWGPGNSR